MAVPKWVQNTSRLAVVLAILAGAQTASSQPVTEPGFSGSEASAAAEPRGYRFSGPPERPRRHFRVSNPAILSAAEAESIYDGLKAEMARRYAASGDAAAASYQGWARFNTAPYGSSTHGRRYVNNYANDIARGYGKAGTAGRLPVGSIVAKDSFIVTEKGEVQPGPLYVMEKMPAGFSYVTGDWRYSVITGAGELAGRTEGPGAARVEFCIACHLAREKEDHLFYVPESFRSSP
ncbi:cytochrome P460 family protein [Pelagibius sp. CAU 1746]|uniref:cytochrome P460 family protein n=1 Tax=Pelagibius sp. CAU 1746 TaxID=3140370 RepID=UPI00325BA463